MSKEISEFSRRMKFLRERDQVTITKLSAMTHYDKERLRDLEAGRAAPKDWELQTIAEAFGVKPEYFGAAAEESAAEAEAALEPAADRKAPRAAPAPLSPPKASPAPAPKASAPPARQAASGQPAQAPRQPTTKAPAPRATRRGGSLDFSEFTYFKAEEAKAGAPAKQDSAPEEEEQSLAPDLFEDSASIAPLSSEALASAAPSAEAPLAERASRKAAEPPRPAPAPPRPVTARPAPEPPATRRAPASAPSAPPRQEIPSMPPAQPPLPQDITPLPNAMDARFAAVETLVYVKALSEVLLHRGLFTAEEFGRALRHARGG